MGKRRGKKLDSPFNSRRISIDRNTFTLLTTASHCGHPLWKFVNRKKEEKNPIVYSRAAAAATTTATTTTTTTAVTTIVYSMGTTLYAYTIYIRRLLPRYTHYTCIVYMYTYPRAYVYYYSYSKRLDAGKTSYYPFVENGSPAYMCDITM